MIRFINGTFCALESVPLRALSLSLDNRYERVTRSSTLFTILGMPHVYGYLSTYGVWCFYFFSPSYFLCSSLLLLSVLTISRRNLLSRLTCLQFLVIWFFFLIVYRFFFCFTTMCRLQPITIIRKISFFMDANVRIFFSYRVSYRYRLM